MTEFYLHRYMQHITLSLGSMDSNCLILMAVVTSCGCTDCWNKVKFIISVREAEAQSQPDF